VTAITLGPLERGGSSPTPRVEPADNQLYGLQGGKDWSQLNSLRKPRAGRTVSVLILGRARLPAQLRLIVSKRFRRDATCFVSLTMRNTVVGWPACLISRVTTHRAASYVMTHEKQLGGTPRSTNCPKRLQRPKRPSSKIIEWMEVWGVYIAV